MAGWTVGQRKDGVFYDKIPHKLYEMPAGPAKITAMTHAMQLDAEVLETGF